jgi:hypothetical protein
LRTRLYILVLGAILIAQNWTITAEAKESEQPQKKKIQIILVEKRERDKPGNSGRSEKPRTERQGRRN